MRFWYAGKMELRQLRYFVAVAEEGNISRAAQKIFLTQSALSRQIKALEEEIGHCLFERQAHSIHLTPTGAYAWEKANELLAQADQFLEDVRNAGTQLRLRVGYAPSLTAGVLSEAVASFTQVHSNAHVELMDLSTQEMLSKLDADEVDVILTVEPEEDGQKVSLVGDCKSGKSIRGVVWVPLLQHSWQVAVSKMNPLAKKKSLNIDDLKEEAFLFFSQKQYPEYWERLYGWLRQNGVHPEIKGEYDGIDSLLAAVDSRQGVAFVAIRQSRLVPGGVKLIHIKPALPLLTIAAGIKTSRLQDAPLTVFVQELVRTTEYTRIV